MYLGAIILASVTALSLAAPHPVNDNALSTDPSTTMITTNALALTRKDEGTTKNLEKSAGTTEVLSNGMILIWGDAVDDNDVNLDTKKRDNGVGSSDLLRRTYTDAISTCGPKSGWIPLSYPAIRYYQYWGYNDAVAAFCTAVDGMSIPAGKSLTVDVRWENELYQSGMRVMLKGFVPGYIEFQVNNKYTDTDYLVRETFCNTYLGHLAENRKTGKNCYGTINKDTKGGTWQFGDEKVSFHALPKADSKVTTVPITTS